MEKQQRELCRDHNVALLYSKMPENPPCLHKPTTWPNTVTVGQTDPVEVWKGHLHVATIAEVAGGSSRPTILVTFDGWSES